MDQPFVQTERRAQILEVLKAADRPLGSAELYRQINPNCSMSSFSETLKKLATTEFVERKGNRSGYFYSLTLLGFCKLTINGTV